MSQLIADQREIDFILYELFQADLLVKNERFADFSKSSFDMIIAEARKLALKELLPTLAQGDEQGVRFENGQVKAPDSFHRARAMIREAQMTSFTEDPRWGGQGLPFQIAIAIMDYVVGANYALTGYTHMGHGTGKMIEIYGTDQLKDLFLENLYTALWGGTMLLTEPEAGSDVGALTTTAVKNGDGTYSITGNKIFISSGEHDLAENIIHPVLARVEGAPEGTKGISLFLVPKIWVNDDGSLGEPNDVVCTGVEEKMGIHGNATCSLSLGSKGQCRGTLLGEENKGMRAMFLMMNEARLLVGLQGLACASASYIHSVNYARQRIQGRHLLQIMDKSAPAVSIIQHPDVRRMLLTMKAYVEGMRSLLYYIGMCGDKFAISDDPEAKATYQGIVDLLIPIAKGYVTDRAFEVCSMGVQIFGGYGYIKEYPMEQLLRDCRITLIYEGTNGIQAMDLLGRKLGMNKGKTIMDLLVEIQKTIAAARTNPRTEEFANKVEAAVNKLGEVALHLGKTAMSPDVMAAFANAYPFMEVAGDVVMSWLLLWRATIAAEKLDAGAKKRDAAFYEGQLKSAEFFTHSVLPVTLGKMDVVMGTNGAAVDISQDAFGGK